MFSPKTLKKKCIFLATLALMWSMYSTSFKTYPYWEIVIKHFFSNFGPYVREHISCNLIKYNYCHVNYLAQLNITTSIKMTHHFHLKSTSTMLLTEAASVKLSRLKKILNFFSPLFLTPLSLSLSLSLRNTETEARNQIWSSIRNLNFFSPLFLTPLSLSLSLSLRNTETEASNQIWSWVSNLALSSSFGSNRIYDISKG